MRRDQGAGLIEYAAALVLASAVLAALLTTGLTARITGSVTAAVCTLFSGDDCGTPDGWIPKPGEPGGPESRPDPDETDDGDEDRNGTPDGDEDRNGNGTDDGKEDLNGDGMPDGEEDRNDNGTLDGDEDNPDGLPENEPGKDDPELEKPEEDEPDEKSDEEKKKDEEKLIEESSEFDDLEEYLDTDDIKKCAGVSDFRRCLTESIPDKPKDFIEEALDWFLGEGPPPPKSIDLVEAIDDAADKMQDHRDERDKPDGEKKDEEDVTEEYPDEESFIDNSPEFDAAKEQFGKGVVKHCATDPPPDLSFKECLYQNRPSDTRSGPFGAPPPPPPPMEAPMIEAANDADKALEDYRDKKENPDDEGEDSDNEDSDNCDTGNSFVAGTRVLLPGGRSVPIEDIRVGDRVLAAAATTGERGPRPVTGLIRGGGEKALVDVETGGTTLTATGNHPFWVGSESAWVEAADLRPGMLLRDDAGAPEKITGVETRTVADEKVYNFTVGDLHTYFVGGGSGAEGVLVHNLNCEGDKERSDTEKKIDEEVVNGRFEDADIRARDAIDKAREKRAKAEDDPTDENKEEADKAEEFAKGQNRKIGRAKLDDAKIKLMGEGGEPVEFKDEAAKGISDNAREIEAADAVGDELVQFNQKFGPNGKLGEVDVETDDALIEVSNGKKVTKENQIRKLIGNTDINPSGKKVVVYAPNWTPKSIRLLKGKLGPEFAGKYEIVTNPKDLKGAI